MPKEAITKVRGGLVVTLAWPLSVLIHALAILALSSLSTAVNLREACLPIVTNAPTAALSVVARATQESPSEPDTLETIHVLEPPAAIQTSLAAELEERFGAAMAALTDPKEDAPLVCDLPPAPPPPSLARDAGRIPAGNTDVEITADFRTIHPHTHPSDGTLPSEPGGSGEISDGAASTIGRGGMGGSGAGGESGTGQGLGNGSGSGGAMGGHGRGGQVAGSAWDSSSNQGEALPPKPKRMDRARYPVAAQRAGIQGTVLLNLEVLADGKVGQIIIARSSGSSDLDRAAQEAALHWTFDPAVAHGSPIVAQIRIPIVFKLKDQQ